MRSRWRLAIGVVTFAAGALQPARAVETITPENAAAYQGKEVIVEGLVSQVSTRPNGIVFLNFGGRYPQHIFTVQLFNGKLFPDAMSLEGRNVRVSGTVGSYADKPQIVVQTAGQLTLSDPAVPQEKPAVDTPARPITTAAPAGTATFTGPLAGLKPGEPFTFEVALDAQELKVMRKADADKIQAATVAVLVPENFSPSREWPIFVIYSTRDGDGMNVKRVPMYARAVLNAGYIGIAADGPAKAVEETAEHHWAVLHAGLRVLEAQWPGIKTWPMALGGNSGGAKRAGIQAPMWAADGREVMGIFLAGCNDDTVSPATRHYRPPGKFSRVPIYLSSGKSDAVATPQMMATTARELSGGGFKEVRLEPFDGGHSLNPAEAEKALRWFLELAAGK